MSTKCLRCDRSNVGIRDVLCQECRDLMNDYMGAHMKRHNGKGKISVKQPGEFERKGRGF